MKRSGMTLWATQGQWERLHWYGRVGARGVTLGRQNPVTWHRCTELLCREQWGVGGGGYWAREEGRKKKRRWVSVRAQCTVSTRWWGEDDGRYSIEMETITTRKKRQKHQIIRAYNVWVWEDESTRNFKHLLLLQLWNRDAGARFCQPLVIFK